MGSSWKGVLFHVLGVIGLMVNCVIAVDGDGNGCKFETKGCTYNIILQQSGDVEDNRPSDCLKSAKIIKLDRAQNDYTTKVDDMEKNFSYMKDAHETRIETLEGTVRDLLGVEKTMRDIKSTNDDPRDRAREMAKQQAFIMSNNGLPYKLEQEFNKLRDEIKQKNEELVDANIRLNETRTRMHETQLKHFKSQKEQVRLENQLISLNRERAILKNQLKDKSYRLDLSAKKATECEAKTIKQQDRILELFRSESTLKEDLMTSEWRMNKTMENHDKLKSKYNNMKKRLDNTKSILRRREKELIACYSAKTSTFCGFEDPQVCGFTNVQDSSDFFDWTRGQGQTPSGGTGPPQDHTCKGPNGSYMFIEASSKAGKSNAILYSPLYRGLKEQCIEFYYHMHGRTMGTLNVYAQARGDVLQSVWRAYGNQGDVWTRARLAIPKVLAMAGYQIAFEGITSLGYSGDMAIDDVTVRDGKCPRNEISVAVKIPTNSTAHIMAKATKLRKKLKKRRKKAKKPRRKN